MKPQQEVALSSGGEEDMWHDDGELVLYSKVQKMFEYQEAYLKARIGLNLDKPGRHQAWYVIHTVVWVTANHIAVQELDLRKRIVQQAGHTVLMGNTVGECLLEDRAEEDLRMETVGKVGQVAGTDTEVTETDLEIVQVKNVAVGRIDQDSDTALVVVVWQTHIDKVLHLRLVDNMADKVLER